MLFAPKEVLASHSDSSKPVESKAVVSSEDSCRYASTSVFTGSIPKVSTDEFIWRITLTPSCGDVGAKVGAAVGSVGSAVGAALGDHVGAAVGPRVGNGVAMVGDGEGAPFVPGDRVGIAVGLGVGSALTLLHADIQKKCESSQGVSLEFGWRAQPPVSYNGSLLPVYHKQHPDAKSVPI